MNIGQMIKSARIEKGYTQEELAELVGVKKSAVAKWENGRVSEIKRSNLNKLSKALNINPNSLLDEVENNPVEMAERHFEMIMDADFMEIFEDFKSLDAKNKQLVKDLIHNLAKTEA